MTLFIFIIVVALAVSAGISTYITRNRAVPAACVLAPTTSFASTSTSAASGVICLAARTTTAVCSAGITPDNAFGGPGLTFVQTPVTAFAPVTSFIPASITLVPVTHTLALTPVTPALTSVTPALAPVTPAPTYVTPALAPVTVTPVIAFALAYRSTR